MEDSAGRNCDDQISSLSASLGEILKFESSIPMEKSNQVTSQLDATPQRKIVLGSHFGMSYFAVSAVPQPVQEGKPPTTILYLDGGADALIASQGHSNSDSSLPMMENIQWTQLSDKFPLENIPMKRTPGANNMFLVKFWANMDFDLGPTAESILFQVVTTLESSEMMAVSCRTSVCSFGQSIGDKLEKISSFPTGSSQVVYQNVHELCDLLQGFIRKLKGCEQISTMNGVLENFSVLQVYTNESNQEMLLCLAFVFEVCPPEVCSTTGAMCKVFRLENTSSIQVPHHAIM